MASELPARAAVPVGDQPPRPVPAAVRPAAAVLLPLLSEHQAALAAATPESAARQLVAVVHGALLVRFCERRGLLPPSGGGAGTTAGLAARFARARALLGADACLDGAALRAVPRRLLGRYLDALHRPEVNRALASAPIELLGQSYEQCLAQACSQGRKRDGVYYTPDALVRQLVHETVGAAVAALDGAEPAALRVLDPACGAGSFLLGACDALLAAQLAHLLRRPAHARRGRVCDGPAGPQLSRAERERIATSCLFGVDRDPHAVAVAALALRLRAASDPHELTFGPLPALPAGHLRVGDALLPAGTAGTASAPAAAGRARAIAGRSRRGPAEPAGTPPAGVDRGAAPQADERPAGTPVAGQGWAWDSFAPVAAGGFDVVLGNPPWGQKTIAASPALKRYLQRRFPSSRGIFDWFRPFLELGLQLTRPGGQFGMVLPDIVLLKNYEPTRQLLLDELALRHIEWFGMAFAGATIDTITLAGQRTRAGARHRLRAVVHRRDGRLDHHIRQKDFRDNPRCAFNLFLTEESRRILRATASCPRLREHFEVHEGIHSGNIRSELFVPCAVDESCEPLLFGRDELRPHILLWAGRHVRLAALPERRSPTRYANLGQLDWHRRAKVLVRRTGDRVCAAVDELGRCASNNFFLVLPTRPHPLDLDGLCALLNSDFLTWYFRTVEPRQGRAFAELKIKHLAAFPLPAADRRDGCVRLNRLGRQRRALAATGADATPLDRQIDGAVRQLLGVPE